MFDSEVRDPVDEACIEGSHGVLTDAQVRSRAGKQWDSKAVRMGCGASAQKYEAGETKAPVEAKPAAKPVVGPPVPPKVRLSFDGLGGEQHVA